MKVLLLGPSDTCPWFNFPVFDAAEQQLVTQGMVVFNQASFRRNELQLPWTRCPNGHLIQDLKWTNDQCNKHSKSVLKWYMDRMVESDAVAMLPNWNRYILPGLFLSFAERLNLMVIHLSENTLDGMVRNPNPEEEPPGDDALFDFAELPE